MSSKSLLLCLFLSIFCTNRAWALSEEIISAIKEVESHNPNSEDEAFEQSKNAMMQLGLDNEDDESKYLCLGRCLHEHKKIEKLKEDKLNCSRFKDECSELVTLVLKMYASVKARPQIAAPLPCVAIPQAATNNVATILKAKEQADPILSLVPTPQIAPLLQRKQESPSGDEAEKKLKQIRQFHTQMITLVRTQNPLDKNAFDEMLKKTPIFKDREGLSELYSGDRKVGSGEDAEVFMVEVKADRPEVSLKKGDKIALRRTKQELNLEHGFGDKSDQVLARLSVLNEPGKVMTNFFPSFYGSYAAPDFLSKNTRVDDKKIYQFQEMEFVDTTFYNEYKHGGKRIPDSVVFEFCLGEWLGKKHAHTIVTDPKPGNWGLKNVSFYRVYEFEGGKTFTIPPGPMPQRIDFSSFGTLPPNGEISTKCSLTERMSQYTSGDNLYKKSREFLMNTSQPKTSVLEGLNTLGGDFSQSPPEGAEVRHYFIPKSTW